MILFTSVEFEAQEKSVRNATNNGDSGGGVAGYKQGACNPVKSSKNSVRIYLDSPIVRGYNRVTVKSSKRNFLYGHEATVYRKNSEYKKAADLYLDLFNAGYAPGGDRAKLVHKTLNTLEKIKRWEDIKAVIEQFYGTNVGKNFENPETWAKSDLKLWPKTTQGQLWIKAKKSSERICRSMDMNKRDFCNLSPTERFSLCGSRAK